ncbi:MAG: DUF2269 domain-containing protein [Bacteroidota bacterium]|nr:DUF2269 domain-containing protein [Bacteroidota bacterium]
MDGQLYYLLKCFHIFGVIIFFGNIIVTMCWKIMADKTRDPKIISFAQRQVTVTDFLFTSSGVLIILVTGYINATLFQLDIWSTKWLAWGMWLFIISGVLWGAVLFPLQYKLGKMAKEFQNNGSIPNEYWALGRAWVFFGSLSILIALSSIYFMVFKPM